MAYELQGNRDPFQGMQDQTLRLLRALSGGQSERRQQDGQIVPPAEAIEEENAYILTLEIPGVEPKQVDVSVAGNTLTVKAERRRPNEQTQQQGQQRARHYLFSEIQ